MKDFALVKTNGTSTACNEGVFSCIHTYIKLENGTRSATKSCFDGMQNNLQMVISNSKIR